jgi:precorrin-2 dehydrogenase/sirohydrochlorin ferrochelatase
MLGVAGRGDRLRRRLATLLAGRPRHLVIFSDDPGHYDEAAPCDARRTHTDPAARAGLHSDPAAVAVTRHHRLPQSTDLAGLDVLWIAGLSPAVAAPIAAEAHTHGVLVNVEDQPELCDFHSVAEIRRGDLLLTVSTGGRSPRLAACIRARLERQFDPAWATRVDELASLRQRWRGEKNSMAQVSVLTDAVLAAAGWLG